MTVLARNNFEILPIVTTATNPWLQVTKIQPSTNSGRSLLTINGTQSWVVGNTVSLGSFSKKDFPALNGRFTVTGVPQAGQIEIAYVIPTGNTASPAKGRARLATYITGAFIDANQSKMAYIASRKTKSPFTNGRGSRSATRGLRLQA